MATDVQLKFSAESGERLRRLRQKTKSETNAEVISNALRLYEALISEVETGHSFLIKDKEGRVREYQIFQS